MWLFLVIAAFRIIPSTLSDEDTSYLKYITSFADYAVAPCVFKVIVEKKLSQPLVFTATPLLWILVIVAYAYSRHRTRMILAERSRYEREFFVKEWFEKQRIEEKEHGIQP
ncbi:hypothetical protein Y032_0129g1507 [Ancylostoma ceylanicum]|nr:hypothetical protein Y032_0129g1507 [Ancylostoma ceylanicum]